MQMHMRMSVLLKVSQYQNLTTHGLVLSDICYTFMKMTFVLYLALLCVRVFYFYYLFIYFYHFLKMSLLKTDPDLM
jgi:hypothetical protein